MFPSLFKEFITSLLRVYLNEPIELDELIKLAN